MVADSVLAVGALNVWTTAVLEAGRAKGEAEEARGSRGSSSGDGGGLGHGGGRKSKRIKRSE